MQALVDQPQGLVVQVGVEVALLLEVGPTTRSVPHVGQWWEAKVTSARSREEVDGLGRGSAAHS